jgi:hypothetical protein
LIRRIAAAGLVATTLACATVPPEDVPEHGAGSCDSAPVQDLVGRQASQELAEDAIRRSGARRMRWISPGQMVTMEFRADRLNIDLDERNRVKALRCG